MQLMGRPRPARLMLMAASAAAAWSVAVAMDPGVCHAWNPLKSAGRNLGAGAIEAIQPALAATIDDTFAAGHKLVADVDQRLGTRVADVDDRAGKRIAQVGGVAMQVVARTDDALASRIGQVDNVLEKRIAQVVAGEHGVVTDIDRRLKEDLDKVDAILRDRTRDIGLTLRGALSQADEILAQRIEQLDETVGRRLGNVDVIATKQRLAMEQTLIRVAVLVGLVVFVVFVLVMLWRRWGDLVAKAGAPETPGHRWRLVASVVGTLLPPLLGAGLAVGVLFLLYQQLPLGAAGKATELVERHKKELRESMALFEFSRVKFHASQLELLLPDDARVYRAEAAKAELIRDVFSRAALLSSESGVASIVERVQNVERLKGDQPDADLLVVKAFVLWQVGSFRRDEHEAASLCARAFRVSPEGFALAPLGRSLIQDFLTTPYFRANTPLGRDSETLSFLRGVLTRIEPDRPDFPLAHAIALADAVRRVRTTTGEQYLQMVEAQVAVTAVARRATVAAAELVAARKRRNGAAAAVVEAWNRFSREISDIQGLTGTPVMLSIFQLNDATYSRARFYLDKQAESGNDWPPALAAVTDPRRRQELEPPRIEWAARYAGALGATRDVFEFQEAERWKGWETELIAFEKGVVAGAASGVAGQLAWREAALRAARLGLFQQAADGGPVPYAQVLLDRLPPTPPAASPGDEPRPSRAEVQAALDTRPAKFVPARPAGGASTGDRTGPKKSPPPARARGV